MKCICGYEQETDFENCWYDKQYLSPTSSVLRVYENLFVCPVCGTVKMKLNNLMPLGRVEVGEVAKIGEFEFIVLEHDANTTKVLLKNFWKTSKFDDSTNDYGHSFIRGNLSIDFYHEIANTVGKENLVFHTVDLTADDGRVDYDICYDYISLLTCDQYRKYVYILDKYRPNNWWWLATAYSTKANGCSRDVCCTGNDGALSGSSCDYDYGVRPFLILKSDILVSKN